jgi:hypothetical protein
MSRNNVTEPEVLTGHTDVICSTSIERIVTGRNAALTRIESLIRELDDISILTRDIGGGTARSGECGRAIATIAGLRKNPIKR